VAVVGNSLGWYAALTVAEALGFDDGFRLVQGIALLQEDAVRAGRGGSHVIYPRIDGDWQPKPEWAAALEAAGRDGGEIFPSVDLGGFLILSGTDAGVERVEATLPPVQLGDREYPLRLAFHVPYHTPLQSEVAVAAAERFASLGWRAPEVTLIDGRGVRFTPWATDPADLARYTLGQQLVGPFDFAASVRVALREYAPTVAVLPGPGNSLAGIVGQLVVGEGYRGLRTRADFESAQAGTAPLVLSMRR
jgi:malonyl CoA-acyl carrier protein transacylase